MKTFLISLLALVSTLTLATEEPQYEVILSEGPMEIREYEEYFVAETTYDENSREGFQRLFKYISGNNQSQQLIDMTAPVTRRDSVEIEMTAPVTISSDSGKKVMTFMIPRSFKESDIPVPLDPKVKIKKIPARTVAVNTYSWFATENRNAAKAEELKFWIESLEGYSIASGPIYAGYDAPMTLPFNKTHEMMFVLE